MPVRIGDNVRVLTIPDAPPEDALDTRSVLELCVGRIFPVVGLQENLLELEVGEVLGVKPYLHSIWIEPEHVEIVRAAP